MHQWAVGLCACIATLSPQSHLPLAKPGFLLTCARKQRAGQLRGRPCVGIRGEKDVLKGCLDNTGLSGRSSFEFDVGAATEGRPYSCARLLTSALEAALDREDHCLSTRPNAEFVENV